MLRKTVSINPKPGKIIGEPLVEPIIKTPKNPEKRKPAPAAPKENPKVKGPKEAKEEAERRMEEWEKEKKKGELKEKKEKKATEKKPETKQAVNTPAPEKESSHAQDRLNALLLVATQKGNLEWMKELLAKGADVNMRSIDNTTPLMMACTMRNPAVVEFLLQNGADPNAKTLMGDTAFSWLTGSGVDDNPGTAIKGLLRKYGGRE